MIKLFKSKITKKIVTLGFLVLGMLFVVQTQSQAQTGLMNKSEAIAEGCVRVAYLIWVPVYCYGIGWVNVPVPATRDVCD